ncbi:MAG: sigma-E factor negative regulatory protein [Caldimonas sp.]
MSAGFGNGSIQAEQLSALVDGEADGAATDAACAGWKADAEVRRTWHAWQLIGDVLRSEDLASSPERDQRFLVALRERLAAEPVVLAPSRAPERLSPDRRFGGAPDRRAAFASRAPGARWMLPSAIAAGFVLVAGTFAVLRPVPGPAPVVATAAAPARAESPLRQASIREPAEPSNAIVVSGRLIRDARLDRYLAAHKQFAGSSALGVPSAFLRSATLDAEPR